MQILFFSMFWASSAFADLHADPEFNCFQKAESEYSYQTEVLIHVYESAKVNPNEFERLRDQLVLNREKALNLCNQNMMIGLQERADAQLNTISASPGSRSPASLPGQRAPASTQQNGYIDNGAAPESDYDCAEDDEHVYSGERVSVGY